MSNLGFLIPNDGEPKLLHLGSPPGDPLKMIKFSFIVYGGDIMWLEMTSNGKLHVLKMPMDTVSNNVVAETAV